MNESKPIRPEAEIGPGRLRQTEIFVTGAGGRRPCVPVSPHLLEIEAFKTMSSDAAAYVIGGAGTGSTMRANREAFEQWRLVPRILRNVAKRDLSVSLFGRTHKAPLLLAPVGVLEVIHRQADLAVARAAAAEGIGYVFSTQASVPMEKCAAAMGSTPRWFQLYWGTDDEFAQSLVRRAEACGCEAIVLTLDTMQLGWRPRDLDRAYTPFLRGLGLAQYLSDPVFRSKIPPVAPATGFKPRGFGILGTALRLALKGRQFGLSMAKMRAAAAYFSQTFSRFDLTWADIARLRKMTRLPIVLKGVRSAEDARLAREHGVDGLIVSNHGGRQLDGERAALEALPGIVEAMGDVPVLFDSGIRSGRDIALALALGAKAVLIGRPYVYGLALAGERGVREVIRNMLAELDLTLALSGLARPADLGPDCLAPASGAEHSGGED